MADLTALKERLLRLQRAKAVPNPQGSAPTSVVVNIQMPDLVEAIARRFGTADGAIRTSGGFTPSAG